MKPRLLILFAAFAALAYFLLFRKKPAEAVADAATASPATSGPSTADLVNALVPQPTPTPPSPPVEADQNVLTGGPFLDPPEGSHNAVSLGVQPNTNGYVDITFIHNYATYQPSENVQLDPGQFKRIAADNLVVPIMISFVVGNFGTLPQSLWIRHVSPNQEKASTWERHDYYS